MISTTIKGVSVETIGYPSLERNTKDEREFANITVQSSRASRYEMYDLVEINIDGTTEQYFVQDDQKTKLKKDLYEHVLVLTETMAIFDKVYPASRSTTIAEAPFTIGDFLTYYQRELSYYHFVDIDFEGEWTNVSVVEKEFDGENFSAILTKLFRIIRATPKMEVVGNLYRIYPQYWGERKNLVTSDDESLYEETSAGDYATKIKAQIKNGVFDEIEPRMFPSENGYILPRCEQTIFRPSKARYELDSDVLYIDKVYALDVEVQLTSGEFINQPVDITSHVMTPEEYDALKAPLRTLSVLFGINKGNVIQYDLTNNYIYGLVDYEDGFLGFEEEVNILRSAIIATLNEKYGSGNISNYNLTNNIREQRIRVKYWRKRDQDILIQRYINGVMNQTTEMQSQTSSYVSVNKYKENLSIMVNRMANARRVTTETFNRGETPYDIFDYTADGYLITDRKFTYYRNYIFAEYEWTKDFANVEGEYSLLRQPHPYTITQKKLTTNVIEQQYVLVSEEGIPSYTIFTENGINIINGIFSGTPYNNQLQGIFRGYNNDLLDPIHMAVEGSYGGRTMSLNVQFRKQIVAGFELLQDGSTWYKEPVIYTGDEDAGFRLDDFILYFTTTAEVTDNNYRYPRIDDNIEEREGAIIFRDVKPINLGLNDAFGYTLSIANISKSERIFLQDGFSKFNYLINPTATHRQLRLYKSNVPFNSNVYTKRSVDTLVSGGGYTFNTSGYDYIEVYGNEQFDYWALVYDNEIVLAANDIKRVYISYQIVPTAGPARVDIYYYDSLTTLEINSSINYQELTRSRQDYETTSILAINSNISYDLISLTQGEYIIEFNGTLAINSELTYQTLTTVKKVDYTANTILDIDSNITFETKEITREQIPTQETNLIIDSQLSYELKSRVTEDLPTQETTLSINSNLDYSVGTTDVQEVTLTDTMVSIISSLNYSTEGVLPSKVFEYQGTDTQSYDDTVSYFVGDGTTTTSCPSATTTQNWFNTNFDPDDYNLGDVIRVITYRSNDDFTYTECERYYFEVVYDN